MRTLLGSHEGDVVAGEVGRALTVEEYRVLGILWEFFTSSHADRCVGDGKGEHDMYEHYFCMGCLAKWMVVARG